MALKLIASIPVLIVGALLRLFMPWLVYRDCPVCDGAGFVRRKKTNLYEDCPTCGGDFHRNCPTCSGHGIVQIKGRFWVPCTCKGGKWPRVWAWRLNLVKGLDGLWKSAAMNYLYIDEHMYQ